MIANLELAAEESICKGQIRIGWSEGYGGRETIASDNADQKQILANPSDDKRIGIVGQNQDNDA